MRISAHLADLVLAIVALLVMGFVAVGFQSQHSAMAKNCRAIGGHWKTWTSSCEMPKRGGLLR